MTNANKKELTIGVAMLGASIAYLVMAYRVPGHDGIDAATVPTLLAILLCLLGALQTLSAIGNRARPAAESDADAPEQTSASVVEPLTVLKTLGLILIYVVLLGPVGFPIMTALYLYLQFIVLTPVDHKVRHLPYAAIAVVTSAIIYLLFREAFDLLLPAGLLNF
ncbi:Tripartite tricarboxylate transporter TctB family [Stutzerimonas stutzeri]|uniref:tripartite tricarboxylate transporter TctB family protein n=1 Tax=Stutzerimonas stutzeri subgroup TaxID=578833 RepID=UPI000C6DF722|nr:MULTISPECIES: tripartite tricarboxylate transporter TctB family protein [Stutzerimonas stutzeri subgroup]MCQ2045697.1 tripartite tricarboxylate transporter TctB family protein [Stutzerimonas kunmingensis]PKR27600.1 tripartite tricarboxylate transporter TctB family protein [Stutzerimonas stutzeri]QQC11240.1 tripartite tricarboxylate transporter TctB family protein [Stutzerimonas stutzeri]VEI30382.1 Tripartite tricarboxylate transporter TctB family [Stutzerimonas stutzeri]